VTLLAAQTVGVMGSGTQSHDALATEIGQLLARRGVNLLTGGGRGVMTSVSRAFVQSRERAGSASGPAVLQRGGARAAAGWLPQRIRRAGHPNAPAIQWSAREGRPLPQPHQRANIRGGHRTAGEQGTAAEVSLAVDYGKPVIVYSPQAQLVRHFSTAAPRAGTLREVSEFLDLHLGGDS